jgi:triosephosphate isomerase (TIM)
MHRKPIIAGNWKMYKTGREAKEFIAAFAPLVAKATARVYVAAPFTALYEAAKAAKGSSIVVGAQNMHDATEGAFTGEISARMLKEAGASFVILGHSERRQYFHETSAFVNRKIKRAFQEGLIPIYCIGEKQEEREKGMTKEVLLKQLEEGLADITPKEAESLVIAYEPVWAIGTGKTATPEIAEETQGQIRQWLEGRFEKSLAEKIPILYGGSVKPESIRDLLQKPNIDGALVGGASLDPAVFAKIVNQATT